MKKIPLLLTTAVIALFSTVLTTQAQDTKKVVILKCDDVIFQDNGDIPVPLRWQRIADYAKDQKIKASFGIIGHSLEGNNPKYFKWIKDWSKSGVIEFWNHGYINKKSASEAGEFERDYASQLHSFQRTDELAEQKLGLKLTAWGPHWSNVNEHTDLAISKVENIKLVFYYLKDAKHYKGIVMPRSVELEYPVHNPDFAKFKASMEKNSDLKLVILQGHPNSWDDGRWENFTQVVQYFKSNGWVFMTPSEYYADQLK